MSKICSPKYERKVKNIQNIRVVNNEILYYHHSDKGADRIIHLDELTLLAEGSYGAIYLASASTEPFAVAIKAFKDPKDSEINMIKNQISVIVECELIKSAYLGRHTIENTIIKNMYISALYLADGDLEDLIKNDWEVSEITELMHKIAIILNCIKDKGYYYIDLKCKNLLYMCNSNKITVGLGDIGSLCERNNYALSTFFPPEVYESDGSYRGKDPVCNEASLVWVYACTILELFNVDTSLFSHVSVENMHVRDFILAKNEFLDSIIQEYNFDKVFFPGTEYTFANFFKGCLTSQLSKRATLSEILELTKDYLS